MSWLPKCNSMRTRPGRVETEVYFRIVHLAGVSCAGGGDEGRKLLKGNGMG